MMLKKKFFFSIFIFSLFFILKNTQSATPKVIMECPGLKTFKKWCAGEYESNNAKSCLMISAPISEKGEPKYKSRGEIYATVYHLPSEESTDVFYITAGYIYKQNTIVSVNIDKNKEHELAVLEEDTAFGENENIDKKVIIEMKNGNKMKVIGFSSRGTKTTDIYSLVGFSAAYTYISNLCKVKN